LVVIKHLSLNYGSEMEIIGYVLVVEHKGWRQELQDENKDE
jgi:hypothetical protein